MMKIYFCFLGLALALVACKKNTNELTAEQKEAKLQQQLDSLARGSERRGGFVSYI